MAGIFAANTQMCNSLHLACSENSMQICILDSLPRRGVSGDRSPEREGEKHVCNKMYFRVEECGWVQKSNVHNPFCLP